MTPSGRLYFPAGKAASPTTKFAIANVVFAGKTLDQVAAELAKLAHGLTVQPPVSRVCNCKLLFPTYWPRFGLSFASIRLISACAFCARVWGIRRRHLNRGACPPKLS
jgi:hypothetical protein